MVREEAELAEGGGQPIGLFDSGVGGLSVLRHVRELLPFEDLIYVADQAFVPYGSRPQSHILSRSKKITEFLLAEGCKLIAIPCNTASAAALSELREEYDVPFVGMEPAVKPGAEATRSGKVGVLATAGTFESQRYASLMERYAQNVQLYQNPCHGLVDLIEAGQLESVQTLNLLVSVLNPMLFQGVDTIVLGCTHYPFVQPLIETVAGDMATVIDPAPAVAKQIKRRLSLVGVGLGSETGYFKAYTTGDSETLAHQISVLLPDTPADSVAAVSI